MKLSIFVYLFIICLLPQYVDSHFLKWLWTKVKNVFNGEHTLRDFSCGTTDYPQILPPAISDRPRVTGGISSAEHSFPWVVNVVNLKSLKSCGGALISPDTVVTAGHCIIDSVGFIKVIAGASNLFGRLNVFNYHSVSHVARHPSYAECCSHDLAIIKLSKPLERSDTINTVCLPNKTTVVEPETPAIVTGWGGKFPSGELNSFGSFSLKQGLVYIKSGDFCRMTYASFDKNDEICAANIKDRVDSREGDSGGALIIRDLIDNRWYVVGVTSHGSNTEPIRPGVYSSVFNKLDFIKKYL